MHKVLETADRLLGHVSTEVHLVELLLGHLHELPLISDLSLGELESVVGDHVCRDHLGCVLARHHQVLLGLLVLKVAVRQRGLNLASCVVLD